MDDYVSHGGVTPELSIYMSISDVAKKMDEIEQRERGYRKAIYAREGAKAIRRVAEMWRRNMMSIHGQGS